MFCVIKKMSERVQHEQELEHGNARTSRIVKKDECSTVVKIQKKFRWCSVCELWKPPKVSHNQRFFTLLLSSVAAGGRFSV